MNKSKLEKTFVGNIPERVQQKLSVYPKKIRSYLRKT